MNSSLPYIEDRRRAPRDDIMTDMARATFSDGTTPEVSDVALLAANLFAGGQETTEGPWAKSGSGRSLPANLTSARAEELGTLDGWVGPRAAERSPRGRPCLAIPAEPEAPSHRFGGHSGRAAIGPWPLPRRRHLAPEVPVVERQGSEAGPSVVGLARMDP